MKLSDFNTFASGNGIPCHGDLIETEVNGEKYRAEFYVENNFNSPCVMLAADSEIEKLVNNAWEKMSFSDDDSFNELLSKITPVLN